MEEEGVEPVGYRINFSLCLRGGKYILVSSCTRARHLGQVVLHSRTRKENLT